MLGTSLTDVISWQLCCGGGAVAIGIFLLFVFFNAVSGGGLVRVPDGERPPAAYKRWKQTSVSHRIGKKGFLMLGIGAGFVLVGLGVVLYAINSN
jgi:hypothetical protein